MSIISDEHFGDNDPAIDLAIEEQRKIEGMQSAGDGDAQADHVGDDGAAVPVVVESPGAAEPAPAGPYRDFPVELLPAPVARFIREGAAAIGCAMAYIGLPLLAALASAIGNTRRIRLKRAWSEPPVLWCVTIGESGTLKSPALDQALRAIHQRQQRALKKFRQEMNQYLAEQERYNDEAKEWKKDDKATRGEPPIEPVRPICERLLVADTTVEALADRLDDAQRGLLVARDELSGLLKSFDQYKQGKGGDVAHWLEMHGARPMTIDRKSGNKTTIYIPRAAVCIAGGIQPKTLRRCLTPEFFENGLAARLLVAMPPQRAKKWTDADIDHGTYEVMAKLFDALLEFRPAQGIDGDEPADVAMTPTAKVVWVAFYDRHAQEQAEKSGDEAAMWSKLEGYAARFALVIHCIRQADGEPVDPWQVDAESMAAGVDLADWFGHEAQRVYQILGESAEDQGRRELVDLIRAKAKGGRVRVRQLMQSSRLYATSEEWTQALEELARAGIGRWYNPKPGAKGGHPVREFGLLKQPGAMAPVYTSTVDTTPHVDSASGGSVNRRHVGNEPGGDSVDAAQDREQGEL